MTKLPHNFQVTDDHRRYCSEKWGLKYLADVFLEEFVELFAENERKHKDWNKTFKNYLRNNSPSGRFYNKDYWERALQKAKSLEYGKRTKPPAEYHPQEVEKQPSPKRMPDMLKSMVEGMRK